MAKITISDIGSGFSLNKINEAFQQIENELNNKVLYRDNPVGEQNHVLNDIDMNLNDIVNAGNIQASSFGFSDGTSIDSILADAEFFAKQSETSSIASAVSADESRQSAEDSNASAVEAANSEANAAQHASDADSDRIAAESAAADALIQANAAEQYSLLGLSANTTQFDMGLVSDQIEIFPTDLGVL